MWERVKLTQSIFNSFLDFHVKRIPGKLQGPYQMKDRMNSSGTLVDMLVDSVVIFSHHNKENVSQKLTAIVSSPKLSRN